MIVFMAVRVNGTSMIVEPSKRTNGWWQGKATVCETSSKVYWKKKLMDHEHTPTKCSYTKPIWNSCMMGTVRHHSNGMLWSLVVSRPLLLWIHAASEIRSVPKSFDTKSNSVTQPVKSVPFPSPSTPKATRPKKQGYYRFDFSRVEGWFRFCVRQKLWRRKSNSTRKSFWRMRNTV